MASTGTEWAAGLDVADDLNCLSSADPDDADACDWAYGADDTDDLAGFNDADGADDLKHSVDPDGAGDPANSAGFDDADGADDLKHSVGPDDTDDLVESGCLCDASKPTQPPQLTQLMNPFKLLMRSLQVMGAKRQLEKPAIERRMIIFTSG